MKFETNNPCIIRNKMPNSVFVRSILRRTVLMLTIHQKESFIRISMTKMVTESGVFIKMITLCIKIKAFFIFVYYTGHLTNMISWTLVTRRILMALTWSMDDGRGLPVFLLMLRQLGYRTVLRVIDRNLSVNRWTFWCCPFDLPNASAKGYGCLHLYSRISGHLVETNYCHFSYSY